MEPKSPEAKKQFFPEIQGLRCWAVVAVILFHLWPDTVPGGFIGVDVFFVISGYLITGHLVREVMDTGHISLLRFYGRRIRRLLPMATLVIVCVAVCIGFLPQVRWEDTVLHMGASTLYMENWLLAHQGVDYLALENAASPLRHYWSLSIEEQFYFLWPLIILSACIFVKHCGVSARRAVCWVLLVLTSGSFCYSVILTEFTLQNTYFLTQCRLWEFGCGGVLAIIRSESIPHAIKRFSNMLGLTLILASALLITAENAFPGWVAIFPVLGAGAVIFSQGRGETNKWFLNNNVTGYLGGISYSAYLWHWPLIVFFQAKFGEITLTGGLAILTLTLVLSSVSRSLVEIQFLRRNYWNSSLRRTYLLGGGLMTLSMAAAVAIYGVSYAKGLQTDWSEGNHPGALVLTDQRVAPLYEAPIPPLVYLKKDVPEAYTHGCHVRLKGSEPTPCEYGVRNADVHIVVVGDSHAAQWVPVLKKLAMRYNWRITTYTKSSCPMLPLTLVEQGKVYESCVAWHQAVEAEIEQIKPDVVIQAQSKIENLLDAAGHPLPPEQRKKVVGEAFLQLWRKWQQQGIHVVAMRDTPRMPYAVKECISEKARCRFSRKEALEYDPVVAAAAHNADVTLIDMTDGICGEKMCDAVVGNVVVWRDSHHLTATYVRTLEKYFERQFLPVIEQISTDKSAKRGLEE